MYFSKISNLNDFVIGTPILNRSNFKEKQTMGMFVSTAPVRISVPSQESFLSFANSLSTNMLGVLRHHKYSYSQILEDVRSKDKSVSNLYNIAISYQITKVYDKEIR